MRDQHRLAETRGNRRGGVADTDHERAAADRGAVDPFRGRAQIVRNGYRRLAGGGSPELSRFTAVCPASRRLWARPIERYVLAGLAIRLPFEPESVYSVRRGLAPGRCLSGAHFGAG